MIRFITTRGHGYTLEKLAGTLGSRHCEVWHYDRLLRSKSLPGGTWIFTDHERLAPFELRLVARIAERLIAGGAAIMNHPARVRGRAEMLGALQREGINSFGVWHAEEVPKPGGFPVFIRHEFDHHAPRPELVGSQQELDRELDRLVTAGAPLRGLLVIEYRGEEIRPGLWRKLSSFRIADSVFAHHHVVDYHWVAKQTNDTERLMGEDFLDALVEEERSFVLENRHEAVLRRAFEIARIEYGRADFGIVGDRVEIYEINTNPGVPMGDPSMTPDRTATLQRGRDRIIEALRAIDTGNRPGWIEIKDPILKRHQRLQGWLNRSRWRP